ncbi:MAG: 4Fe-4S binding protein, partial [Pseudomonadota bacterium]
LLCVFCGMCEDACPFDAIRMGSNYELASFDRNDFIYTKEDLLKNGRGTVSIVKH